LRFDGKSKTNNYHSPPVTQAVEALETQRIGMETKAGGHHGGHHRQHNGSEKSERSEGDESTETATDSYGLRQGTTSEEASRFFAVAWALEILR
jgi:hypothetical protein